MFHLLQFHRHPYFQTNMRLRILYWLHRKRSNWGATFLICAINVVGQLLCCSSVWSSTLCLSLSLRLTASLSLVQLSSEDVIHGILEWAKIFQIRDWVMEPLLFVLICTYAAMYFENMKLWFFLQTAALVWLPSEDIFHGMVNLWMQITETANHFLSWDTGKMQETSFLLCIRAFTFTVYRIYKNTRSLGALRVSTSSWRPFGPFHFVLRALLALRPVCRSCLRSGPPF